MMISNIILASESTLLLSVAALYIVNCPFNKVEESFNTQAVHDVVNLLPTNLPNHNDRLLNQSETAIRDYYAWDHTQFPGVVPRTWLGALIVGIPVKFIRLLISSGLLLEILSDEDQSDLTFQYVLQVFARFTLASLVVLSLTAITRSIQKRYGLTFRICFLANIVSQFHYLFYAGRFLPNTFAAILANLVFATWINRQYSKSIIYIAFCVVIFRFDTALFFGCLLFDAVFIKRNLSLARVLGVGIPAGLAALTITVIFDSFFWGRLVWPEFEGFYFNVWLNKSHEWGVEPFFYYVYNCIPRILMASAPLILFAEHRITRDYLLPTLSFISLYSLLPHKELRFILFVSPFLNICATSGLINIYYYLDKLFKFLTKVKSTKNSNTKNCFATIVFVFAILGVLATNLFCSLILTRISSYNYPGGNAGLSLGTRDDLLEESRRAIINLKEEAKFNTIPGSRAGVYVNNLAAQTGLSRFIHVNGVYYCKTPRLDGNSFKRQYELLFLIMEPKEISSFLRENCSAAISGSKKKVESWGLNKRGQIESCRIPNQGNLSCTIEETVSSFWSFNLRALIEHIISSRSIPRLVDEKTFIKTKPALHIVKCVRTNLS